MDVFYFLKICNKSQRRHEHHQSSSYSVLSPQPSQRCPRCPCYVPCSGEGSKVIATDSSPSTRPGPKPTCTALRSLLAGNLPNWPPFMGERTARASVAQPRVPWENDWSLMSPTGFWFRSRKFLFYPAQVVIEVIWVGWRGNNSTVGAKSMLGESSL